MLESCRKVFQEVPPKIEKRVEEHWCWRWTFSRCKESERPVLSRQVQHTRIEDRWSSVHSSPTIRIHRCCPIVTNAWPSIRLFRKLRHPCLLVLYKKKHTHTLTQDHSKVRHSLHYDSMYTFGGRTRKNHAMRQRRAISWRQLSALAFRTAVENFDQHTIRNLLHERRKVKSHLSTIIEALDLALWETHRSSQWC